MKSALLSSFLRACALLFAGILLPALTFAGVDDEAFCPHESGDYLILVFDSETDDGYWDEDDEGDEWEERLSQLAQLRTDISGGDLRSLYLGWLLCLQTEILDDDTLEPPVPPGLGDLSEELQSLAEFLRIEDDLLQASAERSGPQLARYRKAILSC